MKKLMNLKGVKILNGNEQKTIHGGGTAGKCCNPGNSCCFPVDPAAWPQQSQIEQCGLIEDYSCNQWWHSTQGCCF